MWLLSWIGAQSFGKLILLGAFVRAFMLAYAMFHDSYFRVKYTDIDYMIISDGAIEMYHGNSPFARTTFRYTPLLAVLMLPNVFWLSAGKVVFCLCDLVCAKCTYDILTNFVSSTKAKKAVACFILLNPIVINVSTRGNSDMVITMLSMLVIGNFFERNYIRSALWLGFAIHFKIYPIIYAAPLVFGLYRLTTLKSTKSGDAKPQMTITRFLTTTVLCGLATVVTFVIPTVLCYTWYHKEYLDEALLYHFYREDHRHNFSPYFYHMYLNMGRRSIEQVALGAGVPLPRSIYDSNIIAFVPQMLMLAFVAWKLRANIAHACCIETILFVAFNKVCTVQYFVWFIPFLAFIFAEFFDDRSSRQKQLRAPLTSPMGVASMSLFWFSSVVVWMSTAVELEFNGKQWFRQVWLACAYFFVCQIVVAIWLAKVAGAAQKVVPVAKLV